MQESALLLTPAIAASVVLYCSILKSSVCVCVCSIHPKICYTNKKIFQLYILIYDVNDFVLIENLTWELWGLYMLERTCKMKNKFAPFNSRLELIWIVYISPEQQIGVCIGKRLQKAYFNLIHPLKHRVQLINHK